MIIVCDAVCPKGLSYFELPSVTQARGYNLNSDDSVASSECSLRKSGRIAGQILSRGQFF